MILITRSRKTLSDGTVLPTWLVFDPTTKSFSGQPTENDIGSLAIQVTATDSKGHSNSDIFNLAVNRMPGIELVVTSGNDVLVGQSGNDTLDGLEGDDQLYGNSGEDVLLGWIGDDLLDGGRDADTLLGELGNDIYLIDDVGDVVIEYLDEGVDKAAESASRGCLTLHRQFGRSLQTAID